jgi:hypothetical protein
LQQAGEKVPYGFMYRLDVFLNYAIHFRARNSLVRWIDHEKAWHVAIDDIKKTKSFLRMFSSYDTFKKGLERHEWEYKYNKEEEEKEKDYEGFEHMGNKAVKLVRPKNKPKAKNSGRKSKIIF